jgi:urease accessory protein
MKAAASLDVTKAAVHWMDAPPVVLRRAGAGRMYVCQAAGGPLGGDELALDATIGEGAAMRLRSAAAMVVQPGPEGSRARWRMRVKVSGGAEFRSLPEPTVVCDRADYHSETLIDAAPDARVVVREQVVLGRHRERGGRYRGLLDVRVGGRTLLRQENLLDGTDTALSGPAGTAGYRVFGMIVVTAPDLSTVDEVGYRENGLIWSKSPMDGPGFMVTALGDTAAAVHRLLTVYES